jgi:hypothetical protein
MYEIAIKAISPAPSVEKEATHKRGPSATIHNLAQNYGLYLTASTLSDIWLKKLGHSGTTTFRRMLLLLASHNLTIDNGSKITTYAACIEGKMIKSPS